MSPESYLQISMEPVKELQVDAYVGPISRQQILIDDLRNFYISELEYRDPQEVNSTIEQAARSGEKSVFIPQPFREAKLRNQVIVFADPGVDQVNLYTEGFRTGLRNGCRTFSVSEADLSGAKAARLVGELLRSIEIILPYATKEDFEFGPIHILCGTISEAQAIARACACDPFDEVTAIKIINEGALLDWFQELRNGNFNISTQVQADITLMCAELEKRGWSPEPFSESDVRAARGCSSCTPSDLELESHIASKERLAQNIQYFLRKGITPFLKHHLRTKGNIDVAVHDVSVAVSKGTDPWQIVKTKK